MTDLQSTDPLEGMSQGPANSTQTHVLSQQSSNIDYAVAEQLIQHSQRARYHTPNNMSDLGGDHFPDDYANSASTDENETDLTGYSPCQQRQISPQPSPQDPSLDGQYSPLTIPPVLGQICR